MQEHAPEGKSEPPAGPEAEASSRAEPKQAEHQDTEPQQTESQPDAARAETEAGASQAVPLAALAASDLVHSFLSLLALKAWEGMGLVPNALTGKTQKNLDDSRLAIDAYAAVFEVLRSRIDEAPRREMENLLTTLRLNFVDKSGG
jgi:Domain of unknown function (DUF1844)